MADYYVIAKENIDVADGTSVIPTIYVKQYDGDYTRQMKLTVYNGNSLYNIASDAIVKIRGTNAGGYGFNYVCTFSGSVVTAPLMRSMTAYAGTTECEISIEESSLGNGATANFKIAVQKAAIDTFQLAASGGFQILVDYQNAAHYYQQLSESYALGESGIRDGEETDNAKYYSEVAKGYKTDSANTANTAKTYRDQAKTYQDNAATSATNAANSATAAANSATNAANSATNAANHESTTLGYRNTAKEYMDTAKEYMDTTEGYMDTVANKADKATTLAGYGITDAYTKTEADALISAVFKYKGTKPVYSQVEALTEKAIGDVWFVTNDGSEYAWNGSKWEKLGPIIDMSSYLTSLSISGLTINANNNSVTQAQLRSALGLGSAAYVNTSEFYTKTETDTLMGQALKYKGTKATYADLTSTSTKTRGDMYTVIADHNEYFWNGTEWEMIGVEGSGGGGDISGLGNLAYYSAEVVGTTEDI